MYYHVLRSPLKVEMCANLGISASRAGFVKIHGYLSCIYWYVCFVFSACCWSMCQCLGLCIRIHTCRTYINVSQRVRHVLCIVIHIYRTYINNTSTCDRYVASCIVKWLLRHVPVSKPARREQSLCICTYMYCVNIYMCVW